MIPSSLQKQASVLTIIHHGPPPNLQMSQWHAQLYPNNIYKQEMFGISSKQKVGSGLNSYKHNCQYLLLKQPTPNKLASSFALTTVSQSVVKGLEAITHTNVNGTKHGLQILDI